MKANRGFTLMELMIVVSIVAILTAIAIPSYRSYNERADRSRAQAILSVAASNMERFKTQSFSYNGASAGSAATDITEQQSPPAPAAIKYNIRFITAAGPTLATTNTLPTSFEIIATSTRLMDGNALKQEVLKVNQLGQRCFKKGTGAAVTNCTYGTDPSW